MWSQRYLYTCRCTYKSCGCGCSKQKSKIERIFYNFSFPFKLNSIHKNKNLFILSNYLLKNKKNLFSIRKNAKKTREKKRNKIDMKIVTTLNILGFKASGLMVFFLHSSYCFCSFAFLFPLLYYNCYEMKLSKIKIPFNPTENYFLLIFERRSKEKKSNFIVFLDKRIFSRFFKKEQLHE